MDSDIVNKLRDFVGYETGNKLTNYYNNYNDNNQIGVNSTKRNDVNDYISEISENLRVKGSVDTNSLILKDSLRSEAHTLFQKISNLNEGIGIVSIMDDAITSQMKYLQNLQTVTQKWQDAQTTSQRSEARLEINDILKSFDDTAKDTTYKGINLLSKDDILKFMDTHQLQSNATTSNHTGYISIFRSDEIANSGNSSLVFNIDGKEIELETQTLSADTMGVKDIADMINENSDLLGGLEAKWSVKTEGEKYIDGGLLTNLNINGINLGDISIMTNDIDGNLVSTINKYTNDTGVTASIKEDNGQKLGILVLESDGRGIEISSDNNLMNIEQNKNYGQLTLVKDGSASINFYDKENLINNGDYFRFNLATVYDGILLSDKVTTTVGNGTTTTSLEYLTNMQLIDNQILPHHAMDVAITEDESTAVVAGFNKGLYVVDIPTKTVIAAVDTPGKAVETSDMYIKDNKVLFADDIGGLSILDLNTNTISATINTPGKAMGIEVSSDGNTAYVADFTKGVQVVDLNTNTITDSINTFGKATDVELSNDGTKLYVADGNKGLTTINLATMSVMNNISLPGSATSMQLSQDGKTMYVASATGGINVVDLETNTLKANIATSGKSTDLRLNEDETKLFSASGTGGLDMIDLKTNTLEANYNTGGKALGLELSKDGTTVYVADFNGGLSTIKVANEVTTTTSPTTTTTIEEKDLDIEELTEFAMDSIDSSMKHLEKYSGIINADKSAFESEITNLTQQYIKSQIREDDIQKEIEATQFDKSKLLSDVTSFAFSQDIEELKNISIKLLLQIDTSMLPEENNTNSYNNEDTSSMDYFNNDTNKDNLYDYFDNTQNTTTNLNTPSSDTTKIF